MGARKGPTEATSLGTRVAPGPAQPQRMAGQIPSTTALPPNEDTPVDLPRVGPDRERAAMNYAETRERVAREREEFLKGYKRPEAPKKDCPPGCSPT
jgi:hypothetical protein